MNYRRTSCIVAIALACILMHQQTHAFRLKPTGTDDEKAVVELKGGLSWRLWAEITEFILNHFSDGVHEELTHRIWGCDAPQGAPLEDKACVSFPGTPAAVIYGVQWNDNPPFKLDATSDKACTVNETIRLPDRQPECWRVLFYDAAGESPRPGIFFRQGAAKDALLYRVHFGDLQFVHSMASWNGRTMGETKAHIMMWAEFTYNAAQGRIAPTTKLSGITIPGFAQVLGKYWSDVRGLFTYGVNKYANQIPDVAFGSFMHMVQDSFSTSHVKREPPAGVCAVKDDAAKAGRVLEFYAYNSQDSKKHGARDARSWMLGDLHDERGGDAVSVGRTLKAFRDADAPWEQVRRYLNECVYEMAEVDEDRPVGPGEFVK
jgi:hypothetical protein